MALPMKSEEVGVANDSKGASKEKESTKDVASVMGGASAKGSIDDVKCLPGASSLRGGTDRNDATSSNGSSSNHRARF